MRLECALPTSEKFIVQLSAVVVRQTGATPVYVVKSAFFEGGWSLLASISEVSGRGPPTTVGVRKLE